MRFRKVGVLMGGLSAEREVSLRSGAAVLAALLRRGRDAVGIDVSHNVDIKLRESAVEAAVVALHGRLGEDGTIQGLLEMMGIPYTGSSVLASAIAMDKAMTRAVLHARGVPMAPGFLLERGQKPVLAPGFDPPVVVKPATEGSSVGVTIVREASGFAAALDTAWSFSDRAIVERYVAGTEVNVAILDGRVLGSVEIEPHAEFYDYTAKYAPGGSSHHVPPRLPPARTAEIERIGLMAYEALSCSGAARVDLIVPAGGTPVALEVNTVPGMTETSLLPEIAAHAGMPFDELVERMLEGARLHSQPPPSSS